MPRSLDEVMAMISGRAAQPGGSDGVRLGAADPAQRASGTTASLDRQAALMERLKKDLLARAEPPEMEPAQVGPAQPCLV